MFVDDRRPVGDWLSENYIDNLSPTSDNHFFWWFSEVFGGRQIIFDDRRLVGDWLSEQFVGERFLLQHRKPYRRPN